MSPNAGGEGELQSLSQWVQLCTSHGAQINSGDLPPYLTYGNRWLAFVDPLQATDTHTHQEMVMVIPASTSQLRFCLIGLYWSKTFYLLLSFWLLFISLPGRISSAIAASGAVWLRSSGIIWKFCRLMSLLVGKRRRGGEKSDHHPDHEGAADSQAGYYQDNSRANQHQRSNLAPTNQHTTCDNFGSHFRKLASASM
jgi:hypothetical protein